MSSAVPRRLVGAAAVGACALAGVFATGGTSQAASPKTVDVQILSFNDFHGNLEPPAGSSGRLVTGHALNPATGLPVDVNTDSLVPPGVGGVEYLATHLKQAREGHPNTLTVAAGDLIGASPLLSAAFHDEPTIESMNKLGLDVSAVGNHEFDEGYLELQRMQRGGCIDDGDGANNQNSCADHTFTGADFHYLAANVVKVRSGKTILPPFRVISVGGAKIGFIGMTLHDTPSIVTASGVQGLRFNDEVTTANALVPVLRARGVNAIVVLVHQGGVPGQQTWYDSNNQPYQVNPSYDAACANGAQLDPSSPILPIAQKLDPAIDMIVSGHTHQPYVCSVPDPAGHARLLTSASSFGRLFTETNLTYDKTTNDIVRASVTGTNMLVTRDVAKDTDQTNLINTYKTLVAPISNKVLGSITANVTRTPNPAGETPLGDLIADGQLADPSVVTAGKQPQIAFMNPGGIRADLIYAKDLANPVDADGTVLFGEAFTVQPFSNYMVSMGLTGADIYALLTQQVTGGNTGTGKKTLQISKGFAYTMTPSGPVDGSVTLGGVAIDKTATYRVVANNFLSDGGDSFLAFKNGTDKYFGGNDLDAFASYLPTVSPYTPAPPMRIGGSVG
ncbi:bifunctional metallophosphatase/5'-nucleotidase [Lapillicoccus sp.]|uniref:bifunctional metallophosphatase/5'-nucleotidase n=1 Tax=Lapillicoccus sp. TaxID=1909287 RepID=UPI0032647128